MAKEIQIVTDTSGQTLYAQVFRATDGKVWNTAGTPAFEDYSTANIADYDVAMTEQGTASKAYMGTFPSAIGAGTYLVRILIRAGGSPAESDLLAGVGTICWSGTAVVDVVTGSVSSVTGNVGGNVVGNVGSVAGDVGGNVTGAVGSVTGSVGSVAGNVGGSVSSVTGNIGGSVSSVTSGVSIASGGIVAASFATDAITAAAIAVDAIAEIQSGLATAAAVAALNNLSAGDVQTVIENNNLDHLVKIAVDTDFATTVHLDSVIGHLADAGTSATFDRTTDALEIIAGNSGASAADIADAVWEEAIADHSGTAGSTAEALDGAGGGVTAAAIADAVWDEATSGHTTSGTFGEQLKTDVDAILADTNELQTDWVNGGRLDNILDARASQTSVDDLPTNAELATSQAAADDATLAAIAALNGSTFTAIPWNAAWDAEVQSEVDDALVAQRLDELLNADSDIDGAAPPTVGSVFHELLSKTAGSFTFDQTTDSLEAIRDRGDAAWITATGFSTHSAADVWAAGTRTLTAGTNIVLAKGTGVTGFNDLSAAQVNAEVDTAIADVGLTTTVTGRIDVAISTRGTGTALDAAGVRTAVGLASANLDTQLAAIDDFLDTEIAAIKAKTDNLPASPAAVGSSMTLTSGERDAVAAALLDLAAGVETNRTLRQAMRLILAALAGKLSGAASTTVTIRDTNDSVNRITATVDEDGNRSAVTLDAS